MNVRKKGPWEIKESEWETESWCKNDLLVVLRRLFNSYIIKCYITIVLNHVCSHLFVVSEFINEYANSIHLIINEFVVSSRPQLFVQQLVQNNTKINLSVQWSLVADTVGAWGICEFALTLGKQGNLKLWKSTLSKPYFLKSVCRWPFDNDA